MKKLLISCFLICSFFSIFAQEANRSVSVDEVKAVTITGIPSEAVANPKKAGETLVLKEDIHDFGKIPQGKPVTYVFEVTNISKQPITIANVQASCGCTTPEWEKENPIIPGGNSKITVGYNAAAEGPFTKLVTITYGENLNKQITIKGEVWKTPASSAPVNSGLNDLNN